LAKIDVPYDEWEVLYRIRLQVERDLLIGVRPGEAFPGAKADVAQPATARAGNAPAVQTALATASLGLVVLDLVLAFRERFSR
jgi:hypothetical protein